MTENNTNTPEELITAKFHYGHQRSTRELTPAQFLDEMNRAVLEYPTAGRREIIQKCIQDLRETGSSEYGWTTYTSNGASL